MHILQLQNIKRDVTKKISIDTLINTQVISDDTKVEKNNEILVTNNHTDTTNIADINKPEITGSTSYPKPIIENENLGTEINFT